LILRNIHVALTNFVKGVRRFLPTVVAAGRLYCYELVIGITFGSLNKICGNPFKDIKVG
jgi:hypothetical protein